MKKLKIVDWYVHQGSQREFAKVGHDIYLIGADGKKPEWNTLHRSLPKNITLISEEDAKKLNFDIVMLRSPIGLERSKHFLEKGAEGIANIQTSSAFTIPDVVKHVVWNSKDTMRKYMAFYRIKKYHHHIIHGFDPEEFKCVPNVKRNSKVLTVANSFKRRSKIMGYDIWETVKNKSGKTCDIVGAGNEDIEGSLPHTKSFEDLLMLYSKYSIFLNTTRLSANPRSRAEAALCSMPIVTTYNSEFSSYFKNNKDAILGNSPSDLIYGIKKLMDSENMRKDFGARAREVSVKEFHIKDYIDKWNHIFGKL